ncbi:MAG: hypothetical protein PVJ43_09315 [Gemmatimonadales bacterium]|jgi:multidrug resistance efflux pump
MADRKRRGLIRWLLPKLLIFVAGAAGGYTVRDYVEHGELDRVRAAYDEAVAELEALKESGQEALERGRRAGESLRSGAEAAVDSTKAAVDEIKGEPRP